MRWYDVVRQTLVSITCILLWGCLLRYLARVIPSISGETIYFPLRLIDDDRALNMYRLNISHEIYQSAIKQYDHVVGFLIGSYQLHGRRCPSLEICNVEQMTFDELEQFRLHIPIRVLGRVGTQPSTVNATITKEAEDYFNCLNKTTKARYVMLLEDDALVVPNFAAMITTLMEQLDQRSQIDYVKLYHPNQLRKIPSIPMTTTGPFQSIAVSFLMCGTYQLVVLRRVAIAWLFFLADVRYFLTQSVYLSTPESCCTPAVLFRAVRIPEIVSALSGEKAVLGHAKDHILDESRFVGRQTDANLVVHIGSISSVRKRRIVLSEVRMAKDRLH
ncbi:unnamed protein product [Nippostrongylus brasiliensis]|uniref:Glycosyltransferase family 25 protein n=1 Tax=Nippostrongylus brasiliensis TaxID=27835 RepID=A0A0N4YIF7_NIPBR|nr:unnamed protein product [Nippostrongylus brasiliensis]